jgi:Mn-dependent DtxR family transcriptional regulator
LGITADGGDDLADAIDACLIAAYRAARAALYATAPTTIEIAEATTLAIDLVEKIAMYLERKGLVDYDNQQLDITVEGILRAQAILRDAAEPGARATDDAKQ